MTDDGSGATSGWPAASAAVRQAYDVAAAEAVAPLAVGLGLVCMFYSPLHFLDSVPGRGAQVLGSVTVVVSLLFFSIFAFVRGRVLAPGHAHPLLAAQIALVSANCLVDLLITHDEAVTTNFVIIVIGIGVVMVSARWVAALVALVVTGWLLVVLMQPDLSRWIHSGAYLAGGVMLSIVIALSRRRTLAALVWARERAELASVVDVLTGLYNRRGFSVIGAELVRATRRTSPGYSVVVLDVDGFKGVNDQLGHEAGDRVLAQVGHVLAAAFRAGDVVSRWGGDEFAVVATGNPIPADELSDRLNASLRECAADNTIVPITVSVGIATAGAHTATGDIDLDAMFAAADTDMYARRARGRQTADHGSSSSEIAVVPR